MKRAQKTRRDKRAPANEPANDPRFRQDGEIPFKHIPISRLEPKNNNQRIALQYLNSNTPVVFLTGSAGTGKSLLAAYRAASLLKSKQIHKVFLVRPAVSVGKSVGMLPGDIKEKLAPYFAQTLAHVEKFLGPGGMKYCTNHDQIEMKPVEYLRGMSFENCMVIAEEVQNFTSEEMEMMLTRLGQNCQIVFTGDTKQHDLKGVSGLSATIKLLDKMLQTHPEYMSSDDMAELDEGIGIVRFMPEDVVRSGLTRAFVRMYHNN